MSEQGNGGGKGGSPEKGASVIRMTRQRIVGVLLANVAAIALFFSFMSECTARHAIKTLREEYEGQGRVIDASITALVGAISNQASAASTTLGGLLKEIDKSQEEMSDTLGLAHSKQSELTNLQKFTEEVIRQQDLSTKNIDEKIDAQLGRLEETEKEAQNLRDAITGLSEDGQAIASIEQLQALAETLNETDAVAQIASLRQELVQLQMHVAPVGTIRIWSGPRSERPKGWAVCDGTPPEPGYAETPDLRGRVVVGARDDESLGTAKPADQITIPEPARNLTPGGGVSKNQGLAGSCVEMVDDYPPVDYYERVFPVLKAGAHHIIELRAANLARVEVYFIIRYK